MMTLASTSRGSKPLLMIDHLRKDMLAMFVALLDVPENQKIFEEEIAKGKSIEGSLETV